MSSGTIHPNLYKTIAKEGKALVTVKNNLKFSLFILSFLVLGSFMVSAALATYEAQVSITDNVDRINRSGTSNSAVWQINVTNQPSSANTLRMVNITNATGYVITNVNATGNSTQACTTNQLSVNCTGLNILAGGQLRINVTTTQPSVSGERSWTVHTQDSTDVNGPNTVYTAAIDGADLAFDIYDELGNVTNQSFVQLYNGTSVLFVASNVFQDTDNNGLILIESGNVSTQTADTVQFNVTRKGFVDRNQTTTRSDTTTTSYDPNSGNAGWNNGFRPTGSLFRMKITVTDELGNIVSDATVNVTDLPLTPAEAGITQQSSTTANHSSNGVFYFALADKFDNVTFQVTRAGFLDNATINNDTSTTFLANRSAQATGNSTYRLNFRLRVNVTDELQAGAVFTSGVSFLINNTVATANQSSSNIYYFSIGQLNGVNVSSSRSGYVNTSNNEVALNSTLQARVNPQMPFRLRLVVIDETGTGGVFEDTTNTIIALNNTTSTANSTSTNNYYFNLTQSAVNVSVAKSGYINTTNATLNNNPLNQTTQAFLVAHMNFSIRVTDLCSELGQPGECFAMDGALASVQYSGSAGNTTYTGSDAYINVSTGVSTQQFIINASRTGFINRTRTITTNQSTQARVVFNATDQTATATDRIDGLNFSIKVLGVFDELGLRNFTLNNTQSFGQSVANNAAGAGVDVVTQANNVFYVGPSAYVNATGTAAVELSAFLGNQTMANSSIGMTPNAVSQQTLLFNHSNQLSANTLRNGLRYILNVTIGDELSQSTNFDTGVNVSFNGTVVLADKTANSGGGWSYYFTNSSLPAGVAPLPNVTLIGVNRTGYINSTSNNVQINATNGTSRSFSLNFNLKVAVNDELSTAFTASLISFRANNSAVSQPNSTSGVFAYFSLMPDIANVGGYLINGTRVGYVSNATSDTNLILVNSTSQALRNVTLLFNIKVPVRGLCDELNVTCLTIDGSTSTAGSGGISESGTGITNSTTYSGGIAYINTTNGSAVTLVAFGDGYVNRTATATPNANNQTFVVFNVSNTTVEGVSAFRYVNASALLFSVRVTSVCDELNFTCFSLTGSGNGIAAGGVSLAGNTTSYSGGIAYIPVEGTSAVNLVGFSRGYVNATQSVTPTPGTGQVTAAFNASIFGLNYTVRVIARDQLGDSTSMGSGIRIATNRTPGTMGDLVENISFFRNRNANMYFINASIDTVNTTGGVNVTLMRDSYINVTSANLPINSSSTANMTLDMNFAALIRTVTSNGVSFTGATAQLSDAGGNIFTVTDGNGTVTALYNTTNVVANGTGSFGDNSTQNDGLIYWAINQSNVTNNVQVVVTPNRNGYQTSPPRSGYLSYNTQFLVVSGNVVNSAIPAAATSVTATVSGKEAQVTWTASTSTDVSYYRVSRNATLLGTSSTTSFTNNPTFGDTTAPGAPTSVTAVALSSGGQINVSWTAPASSIYVYNVTTVNTGGNLASSNGTSGGASISPVASYRVFRNTTQLLGSTAITAYTDSPPAGIYFYNITTVSDAAVLSSTNGSSSTVDSRDATAPGAASSPSATVSGKEVQLSWTASTSSDVSYYRIYRNNTLLGTSSTTSFTNSPTFGDTTAPGAASSVSAAQSGTEVQISWIAPVNFAYNYSINTVDTSGNAAATNASVSASINPAKHYLVYRNNTLLGTSSTTSVKDNPGATGIYIYAVTTVSDANVSASSNGTSSVNTLDTTAPTVATSLIATASGKQVQLSWLNSSSSDVSYYRVYRNNTFIGTSGNTTGFVDSPTFGDTTAPGAPTSVVTSQLNGTITISWTAPANSIFNYSVTTVDTAGNLAAANATLLSGAATLSTVSYYRIFRNDTLVGTSSTTSFTDAPPRGVHIYNVTTVSDAAVLASANGTATAIDTKDSTVPAAASSVTAIQVGKSALISWTASTSSDVSYYRVYRNDTLLGTSSTTTLIDYPTLGNVVAPGAPSSVTAVALSSGGQINVSWTAPANASYVFHVTAVDGSGNLASTNGSSGAVSFNNIAHYRVFRNTTQLLGSTAITAYTDSPPAGIYFYNVTTVSDAAVLSSTNGSSSTVDSRDATAPVAATSVTATASGKQVSVTWTASTSSDVSYYRVYRNNTLLGTSSTTSLTDNPALGDTTAPGVPTSVSAARQGTSSEIQVVWISPANSIYVYNVTTVDTSGNLASSNGSSSAASINPVANYRVYRNDTLVGTASSTAISDNPGVAGIYAYNIGTVSDANVASSSNGTATAVNLFDTTAPAAATSVTATVSGKETQVTWTASTSIDVGHYRVYRNATYIGATPNTTSFTENPTLGDTTAPGAPSSVTATVTSNNATHREVSVTWAAPSNSIFVYNISSVDTVGNLASSNGTSGGAGIGPAAHYRVYRNNTLLGTSTSTAFVDNPSAGIYVYNVTTVSDAAVLSSSNGTSGQASVAEFVPPAISLTSPAAAANVTTQTPTISFTVIDNDGGVGVDINSVAVNISGFNATRDCTQYNDRNYTCTYAASSLTDATNHTISIAARDKFGNAAANTTRNFGVLSSAGVAAALNTSDTSAIADNTYANGWSFTFNITLGSTTSNITSVNATAVRIGNWSRVGGTETIPTAGNTVMNYTIYNGTAATYYVSHNYNTTDTIYPLQDGDSGRSVPINGTVTIYIKIPAATVPGSYATTFTFGSWTVALTGGNPS